MVWWLPELTATALSVLSLLCILKVLSIFEGRAATDVHLSRFLTMNGLLAAIATFNRACLTIPVSSAIMQEMWLFLDSESKKPSCASCLKDMERYANACTGTVGSLAFLAYARGSR